MGKVVLWLEIVVLASFFGVLISENFFEPFNVTYDHRALIINGKRRMLVSAGLHYPRATPEMWPNLIAKSKEGGADVIQTYTFWNGHEPIKGQFNFKGRYNLVKFVKLVGSKGLYLHLRIGPYVCAEWNFGGFPVWLRDIPGIEFRTNNSLFKEEMHRYVKMIVDLMKQEMLFSWQGGPIILLQVENEYGNMEASYGKAGQEYILWAARMALGLNAGVPWVMCKQTDAPGNIIDACNEYYCDGYKPNSYHKPTMWTENWDGWYTTWGGRVPHRPVEDLAFAVARFYQRGGSFQNYYMFFGGTNFGRTSGGPFYITSYDYDAPIDEYGLLSQPKWGHLKDLHAAIKLCEPSLVSVDDSPEYMRLGPNQEAHVYWRSGLHSDLNSSVWGSEIRCSAFLANIDEHHSANVKFLGKVYSLPPWSVSILPDCKNVAFNTAKVGAQISLKAVEMDSSSLSKTSSSGYLSLDNEASFISKTWMSFKEPIGAWGQNSFTAKGILEHLNVTKDTSDYLWYITRIQVSDEDALFWEDNEINPALAIDSARDVVRIFVNGNLTGSASGKWIAVKQPVNLVRGYNEIALLSVTVGLQNYGAFLEKDGAGFRGQIKLLGFKSGEKDLSDLVWTYQVGLKGEFLELYDLEGQNNVEWSSLSQDPKDSIFTWYKVPYPEVMVTSL
ncbi:beta-galactosidase 9 isoform X2 [Amborella trichopoda]|uniref:beta-galactosidase 9 isoform X2 n=1 Tax=Amborella trichopoda TaxID=13333 RepID=UPI0009BD9C3A|nr:beta-galactosidase 9 isoform X2 [Amborella trichopoda]|eukprot:XP_020517904.1 beta-galactosidase 9 isoform X2 [Amborella trichopoda]